jgi:hypothetical protein
LPLGQLVGVQHLPVLHTWPVLQPGHVIVCPQLFVNVPPHWSEFWQALLSGVQHVPSDMHTWPVVAQLPPLPQ